MSEERATERIPGTSIAVMVAILLIAFACTVFYCCDLYFNPPAKSTPIAAQQEQTDVRLVELDVAELPDGVAARINDVDIPESTINDYIAAVRETNGLEDEMDWSRWMALQGFTVESLRDTALDYYANQEVIRQAAAALGIELSDEELDAELAEKIEENGGIDVVEEQLATNALTLDDYRDQIRTNILRSRIIESVNADALADGALDDEILAYIQVNFPAYKTITSLDEVDDPEVIESVHEYVLYFSNEEALAEYLAEFRENSTFLKSELPADVDYNGNTELAKLQLMFLSAFINAAQSGNTSAQ